MHRSLTVITLRGARIIDRRQWERESLDASLLSVAEAAMRLLQCGHGPSTIYLDGVAWQVDLERPYSRTTSIASIDIRPGLTQEWMVSPNPEETVCGFSLSAPNRQPLRFHLTSNLLDDRCRQNVGAFVLKSMDMIPDALTIYVPGRKTGINMRPSAYIGGPRNPAVRSAVQAIMSQRDAATAQIMVSLPALLCRFDAEPSHVRIAEHMAAAMLAELQD